MEYISKRKKTPLGFTCSFMPLIQQH